MVIICLLAGGAVDLGLSCIGSGSDPPRRLAGMKRVAVSSHLASAPLPSLSPPSAATLELPYFVPMRRKDESEELVGDLSRISSDNNHGFSWWCV